MKSTRGRGLTDSGKIGKTGGAQSKLRMMIAG